MRGILMVECLYHQTIKGNKTQTRRSGGLELVNKNPYDWELTSLIMFGQEFTKEQFLGKMGVRGNVHGLEFKFTNKNTREIVICQPRYKVGEVLYIKEPWSRGNDEQWVYMYDLDPEHDYRRKDIFKWGNKMFMPKDCPKRAFVRITGIKCERLMDISEDDCIAEGIEKVVLGRDYGLPYEPLGWFNYMDKTNGALNFVKTPKESFLSLYKFANKVKEVPNLWVWAYEFEKINFTLVNKSINNEQ